VRTVYVTQEGAVVRREGARLRVFVRGRAPADVPVHDLGQLVLMGNVLLTPAALDLLVERGVDTVFLTLHGKYRARIAHALSGNVRLRLAQFARLTDAAQARQVARRIVRGKALNQAVLLERFGRRHGGSERLRRAAIGVRASAERALDAQSLDELRGCEGSAAAAYFRGFGELIRADGFAFDGRNRRPPLDPVNALLSLGYTLLSNAVEAAVEIVGLDPYLGSLHAPETGRPSLVCDLVEEWRVPIVDALVVAAVNKGILHVDDFEHVGPGEPVVVRREALSAFVRLFERRMEALVTIQPEGCRVSYRQAIERQVRRFARWVLGEEPDYEPWSIRC